MLRAIVVVLFLSYLALGVSGQDARITDGSNSTVTAHPYQVSIRHKNCDTCLFTHRCGAVVYSPRILISSANCVSGVEVQKLLAVAGSNSISSSEGFVTPIQSYVVHEEYDSFYIDNDISLIVLALELPVGNKLIAPVPLATLLPRSGSTAYVSGWGSSIEGGDYSERIKVAKVNIVSDEDCKRSYGATRISRSMLCAGVVVGQADSCKGDSGGPLIVAEQLVGIVSWGRGCGRPGFPGVYANVFNLREWIEENAANI